MFLKRLFDEINGDTIDTLHSLAYYPFNGFIDYFQSHFGEDGIAEILGIFSATILFFIYSPITILLLAASILLMPIVLIKRAFGLIN